MKGHILKWRNTHTEEHTHGGDIHYTDFVDVLNRLLDGLTTN